MIGCRERIALYALLTGLTALSIDGLLPGLRMIGAELPAAPPLSTQHVVSLFILGMAVGELVLGPLSDAVGRKPSLLAGLAVYLTGSVIALLAPSLGWLVFGRFLQGVGVAGPKIATRAMIRDQFSGDAMARVLSLMFTLFILVTMLAPSLARVLIGVAGWRSVFSAYLAIALALGLWLLCRQPETLPLASRLPVRPRLLLANGRRILRDIRISCLILAAGLVFGAQLLYLSTAADLFFDVYGVKERFPLYFAALALAVGLASFVNARMVQRVGMTTMMRTAFCGLVVASLAMVAASLLWQGHPPFALMMAGLFCAFFAVGVLFGNLNAMAMLALGKVAGLGASLIASGSSLVSAGFAIAAGRLYDGTTLPLSAAFLGAALGAFVLAEQAMRAPLREIEPLRIR